MISFIRARIVSHVATHVKHLIDEIQSTPYMFAQRLWKYECALLLYSGATYAPFDGYAQSHIILESMYTYFIVGTEYSSPWANTQGQTPQCLSTNRRVFT